MTRQHTKRLTDVAQLHAVAKHIVWFESRAKALENPARFLAYAMIFATTREMTVVRRHFSDRDLKAALANAPAGIFDARSWAYWNVMFGRYPVPPLSVRRFPAARKDEAAGIANPSSARRRNRLRY